LKGINRVYIKRRNELNKYDFYEGQYVDDLKEGYGRYIWWSGNYYEGEWKNDCMEGKGKKVYLNGNYYEGEISRK
jgi:hypothetical protein